MARSMNGTTDWLTNFAASSAIFGAAGITYSCWVKLTSLPATNQYFMNASGATTETTMEYDSAGNLRFFNFESGVGFHGNANAALSLSTNTWYRITGTYDGGSVYSIYLNSTLENATSGSTAPVASGSPSWSVGNQASTGNFVNGVFADAAIWSVGLTQLEVTALASGVRPGAIRPLSLLSWCPIDGLSSPEPDLSGHSQPLIVNGTALAAGPPMAPFTPRWPQEMDPPPAAQMIRQQFITANITGTVAVSVTATAHTP